MAVRSAIKGTATAAGLCLAAAAAFAFAPPGIQPVLAAGAVALFAACLILAVGWRAAAARSTRLIAEYDALRAMLAETERRHADETAAHEARHASAAQREAARDNAERMREADLERTRLADAEMREAAKNKRIAIEQQKALEAAKQAEVLRSLADGLAQLSEGNLTHRLTGDFPAEYGVLKDRFNATMDALRGMIAGIGQSAGIMHGGSGDISNSAADLSQRTEQQAARLKETATALREVLDTVRATTGRTEHAAQVANEAHGDADESASVMKAAVSSMSQIEGSVREIAKIISLIDEIAFQTNLLALNAGVEAARAGDIGRGFAVGASEVRALAQRSADAAKQIKTLIATSTRQVEGGVGTIGKAGDTLSRIIGRVDDIRGLVRDIAAAAHTQEDVLKDVTAAVSEMDQVTQQNAAMVEETTAASQSLAKEADQLAALVDRFQIAETAERKSAKAA
jgi:methyl-accepting chemotaxis protein